MKKIGIFCLAFLLLISVFCIVGFKKAEAQDKGKDPKRGYDIVSPTLSPDNKKIMFVVCHPDICDLAVYEIITGRMVRFHPSSDKSNGVPSYSSDGKKITFISGDFGDNYNVFVMNIDGSGLKQLTHDYNNGKTKDGPDIVVKLNAGPSFSSDGERIIYKKSGIKRQFYRPGRQILHWDIYEMDIKTGKERRLTNYRFFHIAGRPAYMPDGKRFIFSGEGAKNHTGIGPKDFEAYTKLYKQNNIFIMDGVKNALEPAFTYGDWTQEPSVAKDGTILFMARTCIQKGKKPVCTYDLFSRRGNETKAVTNKRFSRMAQPRISFDGTHAVFLASRWEGAGPSLFVTKIDSSESRYFELPPWEAIVQLKHP